MGFLVNSLIFFYALYRTLPAMFCYFCQSGMEVPRVVCLVGSVVGSKSCVKGGNMKMQDGPQLVTNGDITPRNVRK